VSAEPAPGAATTLRQTADGFELVGPVTISTAAHIVEAARAAWPDAGESIVDFAGVTEADSAALALIFKWQRDAAKRGRTIRCINIPGNIHALAKLYGVDTLLAA
jgi:phospholipid transport system transporter-binding protein